MLQGNWKRWVGLGCIVGVMGLAALPADASAFWGVAWTVFKKVALDVTVDVISNFITESPNEKNIKDLTRNVVELEEQLAVYKEQGTYDSPEDFAQVSQTVTALKQVLAGMDQRLASFDERLKLVESQMAVFRQAIQNAPPVERAAQSVGLAVNYVYRPGGQGEFKPLAEGGVMHSGDHYKIIFTPDADGYVYLFQTDSSGQIYRLFPLDSFKGVAVNLANPVKAGVTYYVPAQGQSFRLDQQRGPEKFYLLVSHERDAVLEFQHQEIILAQRQQRSTQPAQVAFEQQVEQRGPADIVDDRTAQPVTWNEDGQNFSVLRQRLHGADQCVHVFTFQHE